MFWVNSKLFILCILLLFEIQNFDYTCTLWVFLVFSCFMCYEFLAYFLFGIATCSDHGNEDVLVFGVLYSCVDWWVIYTLYIVIFFNWLLNISEIERDIQQITTGNCLALGGGLKMPFNYKIQIHPFIPNHGWADLFVSPNTALFVWVFVSAITRGP